MVGEYTVGLKFIYAYSGMIVEISNKYYEKSRGMLDFIAAQLPESKGDTDLNNRIADRQAKEQTALEPLFAKLEQELGKEIETLQKSASGDEDKVEQIQRLQEGRDTCKKVISELVGYEQKSGSELKRFIRMNYHDKRFQQDLAELLITQFKEQRRIVLSGLHTHIWSFPLKMLQKQTTQGRSFSMQEIKGWLEEVTQIYSDFAISDSRLHIRWFGEEEFDTVNAI